MHDWRENCFHLTSNIGERKARPSMQHVHAKKLSETRRAVEFKKYRYGIEGHSAMPTETIFRDVRRPHNSSGLLSQYLRNVERHLGMHGKRIRPHAHSQGLEGQVTTNGNARRRARPGIEK
jgi:hypothetical protein